MICVSVAYLTSFLLFVHSLILLYIACSMSDTILGIGGGDILFVGFVETGRNNVKFHQSIS